MLGRTHAISGALAFSAAAALAPRLGHPHPGWLALAAGLPTTAGAALLPDVDHPDATAAHTFGVFSRIATRLVNRLSGGHRHATHSLLFAATLPLATACAVTAGHLFAAIPIIFVLLAIGARALPVGRALERALRRRTARALAPRIGRAAAWRVSAGAGLALPAGLSVLFAVLLRHDLEWLPWSVAIGICAHLAGDCLTKEGCPIFWPYRTHFMLPIIQRTGNWLETRFFAPAFAVGAVALLVFGR